MRKRAHWSLGLALAALAFPARGLAQTWTDFQVGGLTRKALVYVPSGIDHPPLLISLHGRGIGASWNQGQMMKFEPIADREKFIVVYPEADQDLQWDLGGTHDIDFMLTIIDEMSKQHDIDLDRVYASGFSMGGMFSYTLACKIPDKIAAIAPGDGYPLGGEFGCVTTRSVPIFHMHGTADDFVKYSGIHSFLSTKVSAYGCPTDAVRTEPYPTSNPISQSFKEYWGPCVNAAGQTSEIILISVTGMIHDWATAGKPNANEDPSFTGKPFDIDGSEEAWAFLKTHSLKEPDVPAGGAGGDDPAMGGAGGLGGTGTGGAGAMGGTGAGAGGTGLAGQGGAGAAGSVAQAGTGGMPSQAGASGAPQGSGGMFAAPAGASGVGAMAHEMNNESSGCAIAATRARAKAAWGGLAFCLGALLVRRARKGASSDRGQ